jgi:hypothetical protein
LQHLLICEVTVELIYTSLESTTIQATLDDRETLGHLTGPGVFFVPVDESNAEYAEIVEQGYKVEVYVPPPVPDPAPVSLPPVMPTEPEHAAPKAYVDAEVAGLASRLEALERQLR